MDYAFVPGIGDPALEVLSTAMGRRPHTTLPVLTAPTITLEVFLQSLKNDISVLHFEQADDLLIGAHGSLGGFLFLSLDAKTPSPAGYEDMDGSTTIKIPAGVGTANTVVRLGSCSLGSDDTLPVLRALKKALGNPKNVTAPRYLHSIFFWTPTGSFVEYMSYEFVVLGGNGGRDPLPDRDAVVKAFRDAHLKFFDGTNVPDANWAGWVPPSILLRLSPATRQQFQIEYPVSIGVGGLTVTSTWVSAQEKCNLTITSAVTPVGADAERQVLATELAKDPIYADNHPYPVYRRYDLPSRQAFVDGWNWKVTPGANNALLYHGTRYVYELWIPVTKPGTDELIYNFLPDSGAPVINFTESTHPKLFGVV